MSKFARPWFADYRVMGIPPSLKPYPSKPTHVLLDNAAKNHPAMGYVQLGCIMRYPEAKDKADRLANALCKMGVRKGDRVATLLPSSIQYCLADGGISKAGGVQVPCSFLEPPEYLEHKFKESTPKVVICLDEYREGLTDLCQKAGVQHMILTKLNDYSKEKPTHEPLPAGFYWLTDIFAQYPAEPPQIEFDPANDLETLLFTGGTTGLPKGVMLTHANLIANSMQMTWMMGIMNRVLRGNISVLLAMPFFHAMGHMVMHTVTDWGLMQLLLPDARDSKAMAELIREHHPVLAVGVPMQFMKMLDEDVGGAGIIAMSGSSAVPPEVQEQFEKKVQGQLLEAYGLSEMTTGSHFNGSVIMRLFGGRKGTSIGSRFFSFPGTIWLNMRLLRLLGYQRVGKLFALLFRTLSNFSAKHESLRKTEKRATIGMPVPDTEVKIMNIDTGAEIPLDRMISEGLEGELCVNGPQRMLGYWPDKGKGFDEDGFIHTGDVVRIDERGYFSVVDRTKDMIIVSGFKVYSRELDDVLIGHPAVTIAATVGVPDPERPGSERVRVFIEPTPEYRGKITEQEIIDYLSTRIAKYAIPRQVTFLDEMPLTEVQKVNKKFLREMCQAEIETAGAVTASA
ncbi:MAG: class I adenylate-forming enzyme family protein [Smithellaceae bacterium]|nr:class I adenylate-forming enzyme family protein [Smithellaceae bacterium]